jgi:hypothetical protein
VSQRKTNLRRKIGRPKAFSSVGDPYKYSDYLETDHSEPQPQVPNIPFNNILGDNYFDDSGEDNDNPANEQHDFNFDDLVPILEEDKEEYDLEAAFHHFEADAGYWDEGEVATPVQARQQPAPIDSPPFFRFETPPHQRRSCISMPIRWLPPVFSDEEDDSSQD